MVQFNAVRTDQYDIVQDRQSVQGTSGTTWGDSWGTRMDNSEIPVTSSSGQNLGYITRDQAAEMLALQDQGYTLQDSSGNPISIGSVDTVRGSQAGDTSNTLHDDFAEFLSDNSGGVTGEELVDWVQANGGSSIADGDVDSAVRFVLRNTSYNQAQQAEHRTGAGVQHQTEAGHLSTEGVINFLSPDSHQTRRAVANRNQALNDALNAASGGNRNAGGITTFTQDGGRIRSSADE